MKHCRLFPWARVAPLKTPLVKALISTPVNELVVPVLPPIERRRVSLVANWRTLSMKLGLCQSLVAIEDWRGNCLLGNAVRTTDWSLVPII